MEYALETASLHPAKALGIDHVKGNLNFGCDADFVVLEPKTLKVMSTWIAGEMVFIDEEISSSYSKSSVNNNLTR